MKTIIVTGVGGMDGSYLAEKHVKKGDKVIGIDRWSPLGKSINLVEALKYDNFILEYGDITERNFIHRLFEKYKPDYFYNMAAISMVPESFKIPRKFFEINTMAVLDILEEIRTYSPKTRFLQASSSEQLGENTQDIQNNDSKMLPNSPYACSKLASYHLVRTFRKAFGLFACNTMCFNHEGDRRGPDFVTRKISMAIAKIKNGEQDFVSLGNLESMRDWGDAKDYTDGMIKIMEADKADDFTLATGETHTIRDFVEESFEQIGEIITWKGKGVDEIGYNHEGIIRVKIKESLYRPTEVMHLCGDYSKIKKKLGWEPKTAFKKLVKNMVENDVNLLRKT